MFCSLLDNESTRIVIDGEKRKKRERIGRCKNIFPLFCFESPGHRFCDIFFLVLEKDALEVGYGQQKYFFFFFKKFMGKVNFHLEKDQKDDAKRSGIV